MFNFIVYMIYKAFNANKKHGKGLFVWNFQMLFSIYILQFLTITAILIQVYTGKFIEDYIKSDTPFERGIELVIRFFIFYLIFLFTKNFVVNEQVILSAREEYKHIVLPNYVWVLLFIILCLLIFGSTLLTYYIVTEKYFHN